MNTPSNFEAYVLAAAVALTPAGANAAPDKEITPDTSIQCASGETITCVNALGEGGTVPPGPNPKPRPKPPVAEQGYLGLTTQHRPDTYYMVLSDSGSQSPNFNNGIFHDIVELDGNEPNASVTYEFTIGPKSTNIDFLVSAEVPVIKVKGRWVPKSEADTMTSVFVSIDGAKPVAHSWRYDVQNRDEVNQEQGLSPDGHRWTAARILETGNRIPSEYGRTVRVTILPNGITDPNAKGAGGEKPKPNRIRLRPIFNGEVRPQGNEGPQFLEAPADKVIAAIQLRTNFSLLPAQIPVDLKVVPDNEANNGYAVQSLTQDDGSFSFPPEYYFGVERNVDSTPNRPSRSINITAQKGKVDDYAGRRPITLTRKRGDNGSNDGRNYDKKPENAVIKKNQKFSARYAVMNVIPAEALKYREYMMVRTFPAPSMGNGPLKIEFTGTPKFAEDQTTMVHAMNTKADGKNYEVPLVTKTPRLESFELDRDGVYPFPKNTQCGVAEDNWICVQREQFGAHPVDNVWVTSFSPIDDGKHVYGVMHKVNN